MKEIKYHPITEQIIKILTDNSVWFETFEHEPVRTSEEAARVRPEYGLHQGAKALIMKFVNSEGQIQFAMFVMPADLKLDSKKAKTVLGVKDIRFATPEEVSSVTGGVEVGGVPPFGNLFGLRVFVDPTLFENEKIVFNAGDRRFSVAMKSEDYQAIVRPDVLPIT